MCDGFGGGPIPRADAERAIDLLAPSHVVERVMSGDGRILQDSGALGELDGGERVVIEVPGIEAEAGDAEPG